MSARLGMISIFYAPQDADILFIKSISPLFEKVYIYDNTEGKSCGNQFKPFSNCVYYSNDTNDGLPAAYNWAVRRAATDGIQYLLILDQDSRIDKSSITKLVNAMGTSADSGIVAPNVCNAFRPDSKVPNGGESVVTVDWVINSGTMLNLCNLAKYHIVYDEAYFIDRVDADFCRQVNHAGLSILRVNDSFLIQSLGEDSGHRHPNHSPGRHYYIARDRLYFNHKYETPAVAFLLSLLQTVRHFLLVLVYENLKVKKLKEISAGITDYRQGVTGRRKHD